MQCTAKESYGLYECDCCFKKAMQRCLKQNPIAHQKWVAQEQERYDRLKREQEERKNE